MIRGWRESLADVAAAAAVGRVDQDEAEVGVRSMQRDGARHPVCVVVGMRDHGRIWLNSGGMTEF